MNDLTVVLMCRNRPTTAIEAIQSVLLQVDNNFDFLVSDNSSNQDLQEILRSSFPDIETIFWNQSYTCFVDHFNKIISIIKTRYITVFHDDDIMEPNYVKQVLAQFKVTPNIAAVSTNGYLIDSESRKVGDETVFQEVNEVCLFDNQVTLLQQYLALDYGGIAPFCAYTYNSEMIQNIFIDYKRGRNYCDTTWLMDVAGRGGIVWINEPLVQIRVHEKHLSSASGVRDYKCFITTILRELKGDINPIHLNEYRLKNLFVALRKRKRWPLPALKYFIRIIPSLMIHSRVFRKKMAYYMFR